MSNQNTKPLWVINLLSMLTMVFGIITLWLFLPALLVVFDINPLKPGAHEFNIAFMWGLPLMVLANLMAILVLKWRGHIYRGLLQSLGFIFTLVADMGLALLLVLK